jgi:hypothetical protein
MFTLSAARDLQDLPRIVRINVTESITDLVW